MALAAALIESPDVLILDEPTNHLSVEGVEFLETAVRENKKMAFVRRIYRQFMITCPRTFWSWTGSVVVINTDQAGIPLFRRPGKEMASGSERNRSAKNTLRKEAVDAKAAESAIDEEKARIERFIP